MKRSAPRQTQRGVALWLLLILVAMAGGYAFYRSANGQFSRSGQDAKLALTLAQAKEAVIAYAVMDDKHPGRLLCPDLLGDGISPLLARDDCDAYLGNLPWKTLDVRDYQDDHGTPLRLAVYRFFGGDRDTPPINSDTPTAMRVTAADGSINTDVAAIIIAPRGALDPANGDGDDNFQAGKSTEDGDNDVIAVITRQELMAAVEKRIANEVRSCLEQHATAVANTGQLYPWPAPLSSGNFQGKAGSHFGFMPLTEPGGGPENMLQQFTAQFTSAQTAIFTAGTARDQLAGAQQLNETLIAANGYFDQLFGVVQALKDAASTVNGTYSALDSYIAGAIVPLGTQPSKITSTERTNIRIQAGSAKDFLPALQAQLLNTGFDAFPAELASRTHALQTAISDIGPTPTTTTLNVLQNQALNLKTLLAQSTTPNVDISASLNAALSASVTAEAAAQAAAVSPSDQMLSNAALTSANTLLVTITNLQNTIRSVRVNVDATEADGLQDNLSNVDAQFMASQNKSNAALLADKLTEVNVFVSGITTASSSVVSARNNSMQSLAVALTAAQAGSDFGLIATSTASALAQLTVLGNAIRSNGDNLTQTSLNAAAADYITQQTIFATYTAPTQAEMVPYAEALRLATVNVEFWAKIIADNAATVAYQAKGNPDIKNDVNPSSAYQTNQDALATLSGSRGTLAALQAYIDNPSSSSAQSAATTALNNTLAAVNALLASASNLDGSLASSSAAAFPVLWYSSSCDFMRKADSWWAKNQWRPLVLYQINDIRHSTPGKLTVNGQGNYRMIAVAAGKAWTDPPLSQNRSTLTVANFLEGINADPSRDGNAPSPSPAFIQRTPSAKINDQFNDRLAY